MSEYPKVRIKRTRGTPAEEILDFEQAKYILFDSKPYILIVINGRAVRSYQEFLQLAEQIRERNGEFLEVTVTPLIGGG